MADLTTQLQQAATSAPVPYAPSYNSAIDKFMEAPNALSWAQGANEALGNEAIYQKNYAEKAAEVARQNAIDDIQNKIRKMKEAGLGDYTRTPKDDGGFEFKDPNGQSISAFEWARQKGVSVADALQGSMNPNDTNFIQDYQYAQEWIAAANSPKSAEEMGGILENEKNRILSRKDIDVNEKHKRIQALGNMTQKDVMVKLYQAYPSIFPGGGYNIPGGSQQVFPDLKSGMMSSGGVMSKADVFKNYRSEALNERGGLQKFIDAILPGRQFRNF